jgi:predicted GNAT family N-acyltransferase
MIEVKRVSAEDKQYAEQVFAIRRKVFVEEEGVDPNLEYDENDATAHHYLLTIGDRPVGAARWRETDKGIKLERFAVLPGFRNRGFGEILLSAVLEDVKVLGKRIYLHSQLRAVPFYERNGFVKEGEIFYEADMGHFYMELKQSPIVIQ